MSKEATGENGAVLGSGEYWNRVNRRRFFWHADAKTVRNELPRNITGDGELCRRRSGRDLRRLAGTHKRHSQYIL